MIRGEITVKEEKLIAFVEKAKESKECYPDEEMEATWLDAVPFDRYGNPTGEVNEWVVNRGSFVIADGMQSERVADALLDYLQGKLDE
jgi:hypothetical protein